MKSILIKMNDFWQYTKDTHISAYAAYAVYFTILSVFPLLIMLLSVLHYLPIGPEQLTKIIIAYVPNTFQALIESVIHDLDTKTNTTLVSVSAISTLWTSSRGIHGLYRGLNNAYHVTENRGFIARKFLCFLYTFLFVIVIALILMFLVFGNQLQLLLFELLPRLESSARVISFLRSLFSIFLLICFFTIVYKVFPAKKLHLTAQIPGAFFTTICWMGLSFGFSIFIDNFSNYSYMYGSLTTIILLMLWLYLCMNIVLYGGTLNAWLAEQNFSFLEDE